MGDRAAAFSGWDAGRGVAVTGAFEGCLAQPDFRATGQPVTTILVLNLP